MPDDDVRFARLVLRKKWLDKSVLLESLKKAEGLRTRDPEMSISQYLGIKGLLTWEQIAEAENVLRSEAEAPIAPKRPASARTQAAGSRAARPRRPAPSPRAPQREEEAEQAGNPFPVVVVALCALIILVVVGSFVFSSKGDTTRGSAVSTRSAERSLPPQQQTLLSRIHSAATAPREQIARVNEFLDRFPRSAALRRVEKIKDSIDSRAWEEWEALSKRLVSPLQERRFTDVINAYRTFETTWRGTAAADDVTMEHSRVEEAWLEATDQALQEIYDHFDRNDRDQAVAALKEFRSWCPEHEQPTVDQMLRDLEAPGATVAALPKRPSRQEIARRISSQRWKQTATKQVAEELARLDREDAALREREAKAKAEEEEKKKRDADVASAGEDPADPETVVQVEPPPDATAQGLLRQALVLEEDGKVEAGLEFAKRAINLTPESTAVRKAWDRLSRAVAKAKIAAAQTALDAGDEAGARTLLMASYECRPTQNVVSLMKKIGYVRFRNRWRTKDELVAFQKADGERTERMHAVLMLGTPFRSIRTNHFRLYTDLPKEKQWDAWLNPILTAMEDLYRNYQWLFMGMLDKTAEDAGLNVVMFKSKKAYEEYFDKNGIKLPFETAGLYMGARGVSYFFRIPHRPWDKSVIFHEITHQLNDQLLHAARPTWINEGIAQYFEAALVTKKNTLVVGRPDFTKLALLRGMSFAEQNYIPAAEIVQARAVADPRFGARSVGQIYAQMWGLAYFLLHNTERHRHLLLECLRKEQQIHAGTGAAPGDQWAVYIDTFRKYGMPVGDLDPTYKKFIRSIDFTGKAKKR